MSDTIRVKTRLCWICNEAGFVDLPKDGLVAYNKGALVQDAFPTVPVGVREQFQTGLHPACQDAIFGKGKDSA